MLADIKCLHIEITISNRSDVSLMIIFVDFVYAYIQSSNLRKKGEYRETLIVHLISLCMFCYYCTVESDYM